MEEYSHFLNRENLLIFMSRQDISIYIQAKHFHKGISVILRGLIRWELNLIKENIGAQ